MKTQNTDPHALAETLGLCYVGDVNLEYGGVFFSAENWEAHGYAEALRIEDLDSACGFTGGIWIEGLTVIRQKESLESALECCGGGGGEITPEMEIEACLSYGLYDPVEDFTGPYSETVTTDPDSWEFDSWKASKHVDASDLLGYVHAEWIGRMF